MESSLGLTSSVYEERLTKWKREDAALRERILEMLHDARVLAAPIGRVAPIVDRIVAVVRAFPARPERVVARFQ